MTDHLEGAELVDTSLCDTRFVRCTLHSARFIESEMRDVVMRGVEVDDMEIDSPWLLEGDNHLWVNGVDVLPYVDLELNRRFPGREQRLAASPDGVRAAWSVLERTWAATVARVASMPPETVDISVAGEWSFAQTLRHLVMATDTWLGKAILGLDQPHHPIGQPNTGNAEGSVIDDAVFSKDKPTYAEVLDVRAGRVAMVRDFLATVTDDVLVQTRPNPHDPTTTETVLHCLHTIFDEEWEHHRYAIRDLDAIAAGDT